MKPRILLIGIEEWAWDVVPRLEDKFDFDYPRDRSIPIAAAIELVRLIENCDGCIINLDSKDRWEAAFCCGMIKSDPTIYYWLFSENREVDFVQWIQAAGSMTVYYTIDELREAILQESWEL